jgi:hypothetical protein
MRWNVIFPSIRHSKLQETPEGNPAVVVPIEIYTPERRAEFLLSNATDAEDYAGAIEEVLKLG